MAHKFIVAAQQRYAQLLGRRSARSTTTTQIPTLHRRSGLELAGAFLFVALLVAAGASLHADSTTHATSDSTSPTGSGANVQLSQTSSNTSSTSNDATNTPDPTSTSHTTQVTSNNTNGNSSTKVMVDGKQVNVPSNGTKTFTSNGSTTTVTTGTNGTATNTSLVQTNVDVSNSSNEQEGN